MSIEGNNLESPLVPNSALDRISIDDSLRLHAGEFGRWQLRHFVLTCAAWILEAFHTMVMIFADRNLAWRCSADLPLPCPARHEPCGLDPGSWEWVGGKGGSVAAEFGLICGERYKVGLAQSGFFFGCMIGAGVFGHLSDSFLGRKGALTTACILNGLFGLLTAVSPYYWVYAVLRLLTGFSTGGVGLSAFVLATEPIGPSTRGAAGMSTLYFFSGGTIILSLVSYIFHSWRALYIVTSIPSLLFVVVSLPFVSESPRWYLVRGKVDEAMKVMRKIAQSNGKHIPENVTLKLDDQDKDDERSTGQAVSGSILDVIRSPVTRTRLFLAVAVNFLSALVYYGISLNVVNLKTNLYLSVVLNSLVEMPALLFSALILDRLGRRPLTVGTMWFSGAFCVAGAFVGEAGAMKIVRLVCGVIGIFAMTATYNLLFIYTAELFPTVVRNAALGCANQAGHLGAILTPLVVVLGGGIPFAVFGVCGVVGGLLALCLPETTDKPLYDTMAGMERVDGNSVE